MSGLLIIAPDRSEWDTICDACVSDKNQASMSGRKAWARLSNGEVEGYDDAMVHVTLPLDVDEGTARCPYGHGHLVVRRDSNAELAFR